MSLLCQSRLPAVPQAGRTACRPCSLLKLLPAADILARRGKRDCLGLQIGIRRKVTHFTNLQKPTCARYVKNGPKRIKTWKRTKEPPSRFAFGSECSKILSEKKHLTGYSESRGMGAPGAKRTSYPTASGGSKRDRPCSIDGSSNASDDCL